MPTTPANRAKPVDPRWVRLPSSSPFVNAVWLTIPKGNPDFHKGAIVVEWWNGERTQMPSCAPLRSQDSELVKGIKSGAYRVVSLPFIPAAEVFTALPLMGARRNGSQAKL